MAPCPLTDRSRLPARPLPDCSEIERVVSETRDEPSATLRFHTYAHVRLSLRSVNQTYVIAHHHCYMIIFWGGPSPAPVALCTASSQFSQMPRMEVSLGQPQKWESDFVPFYIPTLLDSMYRPFHRRCLKQRRVSPQCQPLGCSSSRHHFPRPLAPGSTARSGHKRPPVWYRAPYNLCPRPRPPFSPRRPPP